MSVQLPLWVDGHWRRVNRCDARARALADRHYSRQTPGARDFMGSGKCLVLLTDDGLAVWGVIQELGWWSPGEFWRCSIFRNEGPVLSSELVREATARTYDYWRRHYGGLPSVPLRTEVDPEKTRRKRDPGRCYLRAGWRVVGETGSGKVLLEAPLEARERQRGAPDESGTSNGS